MNRNKKATYIQTKKLFSVLGCIISDVVEYQQARIQFILDVQY